MKSKIFLLSLIIAAIAIAAPVDKFDTITTNSPSKLKVDFLKGINFTNTSSVKIPVGTTAQRDASPVNGMIRFNSTTNIPEIYYATAWRNLLTFDSGLSVPVQMDMNSNKIVGVTDPTNAQDAATKNYVDTAIGSIDTSTFVSTSGNQTIGGTKTFSSTIVGSINGNAATVTTNANLTGEVTSSGNTTTVSNAAVIAKTLTGYSSSVGVISSSDSIVQAIGKLNGNQVAGSNLTGAITSVGNATSLGSFTSSELSTALTNETGSGAAVFANTPSLITPDIGAATGTSLVASGNVTGANLSGTNTGDLLTQARDGLQRTTTKIFAPYSQLTNLTTGVEHLETGSTQMLANPDMEGNVASGVPIGWTCTTGTCTKTTVSGEFSNGVAAMKIVPTSNAFNVSQTTFTPAGVIRQGHLSIRYRVPVTCSASTTITTLVDGTDQTSLNNTRLTFNDTYQEIAVPMVFGASSAGVRVQATSSCTGNIFLDMVEIKQGLIPSNVKIENGWTPCTFSSLAWQGMGTVTNNLKCKRLGDSLKMRGYFAAGTPTSSIIQIPLPSNFGSLAVSATVDSGTSFGSIFRNVTGADVFYNTSATVGAAFFGMSSALINAGSNPAIAVGGTSVAGEGNVLTINGELTIPIQDWVDYSNGYSQANHSLAGDIYATSATTCSPGSIIADGSAISRTTYAELFARIGTTHGSGNGSTTFNVPDYRGRFLRGVDGSAGNDPNSGSRTAMNTGGNTGNNVGSVQTDAFQGHKHSATGSTAAGPSGYFLNQGSASNFLANSSVLDPIGDGSNGTPRTASETRPKNAYVTYCVRTEAANLITGSFQNALTTPLVSLPKFHSARITTTSGAVAQDYGSLISSCTAANPTVCTFNANKFTVTPNCTMGVFNTTAIPRINAVSSTGITLRSVDGAEADIASTPIFINCHGY